MSGKVKGIVVALVIVLILGGVLTWLLLMPKDETEETEDNTSQSSELSSLLYDKNPQDINNIEITNDQGTYKIEKFDEDVYGIKELMYVPMDFYRIQQILDKSASLTVQKTVVENSDDISKYGLDKPRAKFTVTFDDSAKTVKEVAIGNETPVSGKTYLMVDNNKTVYTVNNDDVAIYFDGKIDCVDKTVYYEYKTSDTSDTTDYRKVDKIKVERKDLDYAVEIVYDENNKTDNSISYYKLVSPVVHNLSASKARKVTEDVFGLTADSIEALIPSEEQLEEFGLKDPLAKVVFSIPNGNGDFQMLIGNECYDDNGKLLGHYCIVKDINVVYVFSNEKLVWLDFKPTDITTDSVITRDINSVSLIDIDTDNMNVRFTAQTDENGIKATLDKKEISTELYTQFYNYVLSAPAESIYLDETDKDPVAVVTIKSDKGTDVIEFIPSEERKTIIRVNGVVSFKCATAYVDTLLSNLELVKQGKDIVTTW